MQDLLAADLSHFWTTLSASANTGTTHHTDTETLVLVLVLVLPLPNWLCGPHLWGKPAEGNKTGGPDGSRGTSLISPVACGGHATGEMGGVQ